MFTNEMFKRYLEYWETVYATTHSEAKRQRAKDILTQYGQFNRIRGK